MNEYGFKCPNCDNDTKFGITTRHVVTINGIDVDPDGSCGWEDDDEMCCEECSHTGEVKSFVDE